ncbi:MAG TPA: cytochrome c [Pirellulales bacterium]|nr:cytochrome c [Pirellulales bacterium]
MKMEAYEIVAPTLRGGDTRSPKATTNPVTECRGYFVVTALVCILAAGCTGQDNQPQFRLNIQDILDPQIISSQSVDAFRVTGAEKDDDEVEEKQTNAQKLQFISTALYAAFGTPNEPNVFPEFRWNAEEKTGLDLKKITLAAGPYGGNAAGTQRGLFRQHCAHCHGITGDGAGPTAAFLEPYPRDYRQGVFKFKSTLNAAKPTSADLKRTIIEGIPGTAMPSFALLPNDEVEALVEYVKYLSVRGQSEMLLAIMLLGGDDLPEGETPEAKAQASAEYIKEQVASVIAGWDSAKDSIVNPPERPETSTPEELAASIERGRTLFLSKEAQCIQCHGPTALGDGKDGGPIKDYDNWNKMKLPGDMDRWLLPKQVLRPRNLRLGIYRGGRRPMDIYRRVHSGIGGTPMPAGGEGATPVLKAEDIWHVVDFVLSLPYEEASEPARFEVHETQVAGRVN